ncbi:formimidoylglutamase [Thermoflexus sp.]|uniref:formimidoylglutamase n=1 Tax=Thermoflexus sp. TaxID=1969742 RepID=UPI0025F6AF3A|nr:formimidoylglutamase [Thermoflexus sp.]MCS7349979.1 formimidoylglutamase [Thermoflexus sp.]MCX7690171.1 formimidoylglutamase [Thermoflexus sp.]MDW8179427.1 formimidoylglutamase [Anaerolineae bacterium]
MNPFAWLRPPDHSPVPPDPRDVRIVDLLQADPSGAHVALIGIPFDTTVIGRRGAREAPGAIRRALLRMTAFDLESGVDLAGILRLADFGDIAVVHTDVHETHRRIAAVVAEAVRRGLRPLVLGGDHGLSYATIRGVREGLGGKLIGVIQFDAHHDLREPLEGEITSGTPFRRLLEEGILQGRHLVQIGLLGGRNSRAYYEFARQHSLHIVPAARVHQADPGSIVQEAFEHTTSGTAGFWISFDMDVFDSAYAPGVSAPSPGGLTAFQGLTMVRQLAAHPACLGMDLMETAPPLDPDGRTVALAAAVAYRFLVGQGQLRQQH